MPVEEFIGALDSKADSSSIDRREKRPHNVRVADCSIGPDSTYHKMKGICKGAVRFRRDGGWNSLTYTTEYAGDGAAAGGDMLRASDGIIPFQFEDVTKVGRCGGCAYAHEVEDIDLDKAEACKPVPLQTLEYQGAKSYL